MTSAIKHISIIGAGALGAVYASLFFDMDKDCVSFIASGDRLQRLRREGVIVNGRQYRIPVIPPDDSSPPADLIMVAVKHHHLDAAIDEMKSRIGPKTIIISVMNGIDSEERIGAACGMEKVLYALNMGIDALREGNRVTFTTLGKIFFGEARNPSLTDRVVRVHTLFERAGIVYETPPDMIRTLWWKFLVNVGINQASAVLRATYGVFQTAPEARSLMESAMREVIAIAGRAGVNLSERDITEFYKVLATLGPNGKTSMLQDVEAGRKTEVDMLAGTIIALGTRYGIPTTVNQSLYDAIRAMETAKTVPG
jgi:2-dehydropantoate 2-reductase